MKLAFVVEYAAGGSHNITIPVISELRRRGHEVDYFECFKGTKLGDLDRTMKAYDAVHFVNTASMGQFPDIVPPFSLTIHHMTMKALDWYARVLLEIPPDQIVTPDRFALRQLGQMGHTNVRHIPNVIDASGFYPLAPPKQFTVGYLGTKTEATKRIHIVEAAASEAKVGVEFLFTEPWKPQAEVLEFYRKISCYMVASFDDGGPVPPMEALLCGRPVVTTHVGMMEDIIESGENGLFFNGSSKDGARALKAVEGDYDHFRRGALETMLPRPWRVAQMWETMFEEMVR